MELLDTFGCYFLAEGDSIADGPADSSQFNNFKFFQPLQDLAVGLHENYVLFDGNDLLALILHQSASTITI